MGAAYENSWQNNYGGDWALTIEPLKEQLITPPATATKSQYTVTSKSDPSPRIVEVMTDNNDIYVKGLFKAEKLANTWVKLTKQGDKAVMSTNQYLGITKKTDFRNTIAISQSITPLPQLSRVKPRLQRTLSSALMQLVN